MHIKLQFNDAKLGKIHHGAVRVARTFSLTDYGLSNKI